ncbi:MAG: glycosyltransferase family 4 protein [Ferruginibacter sp.]
MLKKKVLFVGSFKDRSKDGGVGGQMFACKTIVNSDLGDSVNWTLIDTTADSNILSSSFTRLKKAVARLFKFTYYLIFFKHEYILVFVADGWSFWEKGVMSLLAKCITKSKVIIAPRSGLIINDIGNKGKLRSFVPYVLKKVDIVVCQSKYWKTLFEEVTGKPNDSKFIVIENIIDFNKYKDLPIRDLKKDEKITILFMGWVKKNKGIFELIAAIKLLKKDNLNFKLIIAGMGEDYDKVVSDVESCGLADLITFRGWVLGDSKIELLSNSDIFVLPTHFEGYPNSLMEAMAAGKACIASNVGSIPDMINSMENGIIIERQDHKHLYESLKILIEDIAIRKKMAVNAREQVRRMNAIPVGIQKYRKLFSS